MEALMMRWSVSRPRQSVFLGVAVFVIGLETAQAQTPASATITYDGAGRTATTVYSDQTCVTHKYDANGNRVATTITKADVPEASVWGSGVWGCFEWKP